MADQLNTQPNQNEEYFLYEAEPSDLDPLIQREEDFFYGTVLLNWTGPSDLPDEENRRWFVLIMVASFTVILLAVFIGELILALIIAGVAWLSYLLRRLPSQDIDYAITTTGFFAQDKFYPWSELNGFWLVKDHGHYVLGLETNRRFFGSLMVLLGTQNPFEVKEALSNFIPEHEHKSRSQINVFAEWSGKAIDFVAGKAQSSMKQLRAPKKNSSSSE